jgi:PAT family beta-lactamase induction signal transducer AmpG
LFWSLRLTASPLPISAPEPAAAALRGPLVLLGALYAAQGLPYGFFSLALPVLLREAGWSLTSIGFLHLLALPWALKFLWAPWVDHHFSRKAWLLGLQGAALLAALCMSMMKVDAGSTLLLVAVFGFNLIAATQDIVTDGLAVRLLDAQGRGLANGLQVGAYRLGMILGGGLLLWVFARTNWQVMFWCMAALLALSTVPVWFMREPLLSVKAVPASPTSDSSMGSHAHAPASLLAPSRPKARELALGWWHRAVSPAMLTLAGLIVCFRFGDQIVSALITPFLSDQGLGKETIALMKGTVGSATSLGGAALGAVLMVRWGRRQALLWCGLAQSAGFALYIAVALGHGGEPLLWAATVLEGLVGTMATVALFALMMDAASPEHAGTDYSWLASVVVVVAGLGNLVAGVLADAMGYAATFSLGAVLSALGCVFLVRWLDHSPTHERVAQAWR